jgi:hypothetical protein
VRKVRYRSGQVSGNLADSTEHERYAGGPSGELSNGFRRFAENNGHESVMRRVELSSGLAPNETPLAPHSSALRQRLCYRETAREV